MKSIICRLQNTVRNLTPNEGENPTGIWRASAFRFTEETGEKIQMPRTENPYLYIVLDGTLRLYTPSGIMDYIPGQYSISKIDTPLSGTVLSFSDSRDFLSLSLKFTVNDVISSVLELDDDLTEKIVGEKMEENLSTAADQAVLQSVQKLFSAMQETVPSEFLRRAVMKEIIYYMYMLCGSCGRQLLQSVVNITQAEEIYKANSWIKENFHSSFTVEELAEQRNMSVSLFHQKFRNAVGMGPLQCQKRLRLTEARRLMLDEKRNVTEASADIGYESLSQFIRDYRKMFGKTSKEDIQTIHKQLKK